MQPRLRPSTGQVRAPGALRALLVANLRFWATVAPRVGRELAEWRARAGTLEDAQLRELALQKLNEEAFNAEVAATLATLAPRRVRADALAAIVSLELLFDYLDGRGEQTEGDDPVAVGMSLMAVFSETLKELPTGGVALEGADAPYLTALAARVRAASMKLPGIEAVRVPACAALERCAEAQVRIHAAAALGDGQLKEWATAAGRDSGLGWREYAAGGASSVLSVHALLGSAGRAQITAAQAASLDRCYLATGALITLLDSLVDRSSDLRAGGLGFVRLYPDAEDLAESMRTLARSALGYAWDTPDAAHHAMTLAGVVAFYGSHPGARDPQARPIVAMLFSELSPTIWPALAVMGVWRGAKRVRALLPIRAAANAGENPGKRQDAHIQ